MGNSGKNLFYTLFDTLFGCLVLKIASWTFWNFSKVCIFQTKIFLMLAKRGPHEKYIKEKVFIKSILWEMFIVTLSPSAVFIYKTVSRSPFNLLRSGDKRLRFHEEMRLISRTWYTFHQKSKLKIKTSKN